MQGHDKDPLDELGGGWDAHADQQRRALLQWTPRQRLEWLEQAIAFAQVAAGRARAPRQEDAAPAE